MTTWQVILLAAICVLGLKAAGWMVPPKALDHPTIARVSDLLTAALLAALIGVQTLGAGQSLQLDARLPAVAIAAGLYALRVPFIVVVPAAAVVAALIRLFT
ncbi:MULTISPECIES: AzlD domain-containing protein [unclassified Leifsonia]|uniref:AzlD domain-containing protein n=1 Tax=unclassified Leifsonia TaxID=2663824 RepID=UPI0008A775F9|nr:MULTISPECIES: AzlD domain-containing protein [unclassified Leifsonia]SEH61715.1 Branched-chain amino acid transport protein (AzlD) [Leifsonia sp. CL154]SFL17667.1 Branched-chain amino acid transport protein (AzlD) [Leifsonia sp. CL147]